jgi:AcrR family transcriptional regulator
VTKGRGGAAAETAVTKTELDPVQEQGTRERILAAAMEEFARHGSSGARVERIAKSADVNIRMIYYFFGSKKALLNEVLSQHLRTRQAQVPPSYSEVSDLLLSWYDSYAADPRRVRLLLWEALEIELPDEADELTNLEERRQVVKRRVALIADLQKRGRIPAGLDAKMLYLFFVALSIYPMSFPQTVLVATGGDIGTPAFRRKYRKFLASLLELWLEPGAKT